MATATAARAATSRLTWQERALALAAKQRAAHGGICWKTKAIHFSADGARIVSADYRVESLSNIEGWHDVHFDAERDTATCAAQTCAAAAHGRPCCHAGIALLFGRAAAMAWAAQATADRERAARLDDAAMDNARALGYR